MATKPTLAPVRITHFRVTHVESTAREGVFDFLRMITVEKRTGALQVNYSQGVPCSIEFKEKEKT